jgi:hypothetical protein
VSSPEGWKRKLSTKNTKLKNNPHTFSWSLNVNLDTLLPATVAPVAFVLAPLLVLAPVLPAVNVPERVLPVLPAATPPPGLVSLETPGVPNTPSIDIDIPPLGPPSV